MFVCFLLVCVSRVCLMRLWCVQVHTFVVPGFFQGALTACTTAVFNNRVATSHVDDLRSRLDVRRGFLSKLCVLHVVCDVGLQHLVCGSC